MPMGWYGDRYIQRMRQAADRGVTKATIHLKNQAKVTLSVPAPRKRVQARRGVFYYRATTPAIKSAPPRKLSGHLRRSVASETDKKDLVGRVGTNVIYGRVHEHGDHPWLDITYEREKGRMVEILANEITNM